MYLFIVFREHFDNGNKKILLSDETYPDPSASISFTISLSALGFTRNPIIDKIVPIVSTCIAPSTQNPSKHFFSTEKIIVFMIVTNR